LDRLLRLLEGAHRVTRLATLGPWRERGSRC
jgi:hypothetical protein